ncbi:MAG: cyclase family protein [Sutterella wadsworthensis]|nr:hypothetical protein [Sutterella wadsworthensis]OLA87547.1 MAG: hypothetical protein BHW61_09545 [Sutterella sp. 63_29]
MTRNAIVDALGVLKAGRIVDLTHLVHPGIQRFGPFPAMRIEPRYTVAESGFHVEEVTFVTQYGTHVDAPALRAALRGHRRRRRRALSGLGP